MDLPDQSCIICGKSFVPRRRPDKTCSLDCQVQWRRLLSRKATARNYKPRPPRPDANCESCGARVQAPRSGPTARWCSTCKANREHVRGRNRTSVRRCYKCQVPLPEAARQPGKAVCDDCRVDRRIRAIDHEQRRRLRKYGLTQDEYERILLDQCGRCLGCGTEDPGFKGWCIDHCHKSGRVRALLCGRCNIALGLTDENPVVLRALADFVERANRMNEAKI